MERIVLVAIIVAGCTAGDEGETSFGSTITTTISSTSGSTGDDTDATSSDTSSSSTTSSTTSTQTTADPETSGTPTTDPVTTDSGDVGCPQLGGEDCSPGPGSGEPDTCVDGVPCFLDLVQQGVQTVIATHPEWFDAIDPTLVLETETESYMNAVVAEVGAQGVCAIRDPNAGDEMAVKHDQAFAESYDILSADGHARYGELIYTATCSPAWF